MTLSARIREYLGIGGRLVARGGGKSWRDGSVRAHPSLQLLTPLKKKGHIARLQNGEG
jgi:hypothetical protein